MSNKRPLKNKIIKNVQKLLIKIIFFKIFKFYKGIMRHTKLNLIETIIAFAVIAGNVSSIKLFEKLKNLHEYQGLA